MTDRVFIISFGIKFIYLLNISSLVTAFKFYWDAKTVNSIHSPYLYKLAEAIFDIKKSYYADAAIERLRSQLCADRTQLTVIDHGAGSQNSKSDLTKSIHHQRSIASIAKRSSSNKYKCRLLRSLVLFHKPKVIVELGTNLGLATAYMHLANTKAIMYTVEGSEEIYKQAKVNLEKLGCQSIKMHQQLFSEFILENQDLISQSDFVFIDGDHSYQGTVNYVDQVWSAWEGKTGQQMMILDDIYWSSGMTRAWEEIKAKYPCRTIDIYKLGILIRDADMPNPEHIKLVPRLAKPWKMGFFV